jgi:MFS family permease
LFKQLRILFKNYPKQFWVLFFGLLISVSGVSLVWPFLTIYLTEHLQIPLTTVTGLIAIESVMTIVSTTLIGPIMDRIGRKWIMVVSLGVSALIFVFLGIAQSVTVFAVLMAVRGLFAPLFRVGTNTMVTDMIPDDERLNAFSLVRTSSNVGFAFGPAVGGFIAAASFKLSLDVSAVVTAVTCILAVLLLKETLPDTSTEQGAAARPSFEGYGRILKDGSFLTFLSGDTLLKMGNITMFVLLSVYVKENFGIPESQYGFIMTVNALMAAFLQYPVTHITRRYPPALMLALGAVFYGLGLGSVALGSVFIHFVISMVIMTMGELILMPTAMTIVARISPMDMRGRYMSAYSLTMGAAKGFGPMIGGFLNDAVAPVTMWYGAMTMAFGAMGIYLLLHRRLSRSDAGAMSFRPKTISNGD